MDESCIYQAEHHVLKKVLRILHGMRSSTPSIAIPNFHPFGLLFLLNEKQTQIQKVVRSTILEDGNSTRLSDMQSLTSTLEFMSFVTGGIIVEAEHIDELCIALKKEFIQTRNKLNCMEIDLSALLVRGGATHVQLSLATHFGKSTQSFVLVKKNELRRKESRRLSSTPPLRGAVDHDVHLMIHSVEELKKELATLRERLHVSLKVQSILHGSGKKIETRITSGTTSHDIVFDLPLLLSVRKAQHSIRDATYEIRKGGSLHASLSSITRLQEFLEYVAWGVSSAVEDLEATELKLRKWFRTKPSEAILAHLEEQNVQNKRLSCAALRYNQSTSIHRSSLSVAPLSVSQSNPNVPMPSLAKPQEDRDQKFLVWARRGGSASSINFDSHRSPAIRDEEAGTQFRNEMGTSSIGAADPPPSHAPVPQTWAANGNVRKMDPTPLVAGFQYTPPTFSQDEVDTSRPLFLRETTMNVTRPSSISECDDFLDSICA